MHRYQTLLQPSLQTGTMVQKVDVSALATRRNRSFYLFEGLGINSRVVPAVRALRQLFENLGHAGVRAEPVDERQRTKPFMRSPMS